MWENNGCGPGLSILLCDGLHSEQEPLNSAGCVLLLGTQRQLRGLWERDCTTADKSLLLFSHTVHSVLKKGTV